MEGRRKQKMSGVILGNESGASIIFVLASMLFLMIIGLSSLTAASANAGAGITRRVHSQLNAYADSIQKSIKCSLQNVSEADEIIPLPLIDAGGVNASASTLGEKVISVLYCRAADEMESEGIKSEFGFSGKVALTLESSLIKDSADILEETGAGITISVEIEPYEWDEYGGVGTPDAAPSVVINPPVYWEVPEADGDGEFTVKSYKSPWTACVNAKITVTATVKYKRRSIISRAVYHFTDIELKASLEDSIEIAGTPAASEEYSGVMYITNAGERRFITYEIVDKTVEE